MNAGLDWQRFCSDALLECFQIERDVLQTLTPHIPLTTNFMGWFKPLDHWRWAPLQDVISVDCYPDPAAADGQIHGACTFDLARSLGRGAPWLLMEQAPGQVQWRAHNRSKRPGLLRLWSYQAIARGANSVLFFQWRASLAGAEKFHSGLVAHGGTEQSRVWREVAELGGELARLTPLLGSRVEAEVAIVFDWENWWAMEGEGQPSSDLKAVDRLRTFYDPLWQRNITVDVVPPEADLSRYRLVVVPSLYLVRDGVREYFERYVRDGGTLLMSFWSGIVDANDHVRPDGYPAQFRRLLGLRISEWEPYGPAQRNMLRWSDGREHACSLWSDLLDPEGADVLAWYGNDWYAGRAAITRHRFGDGSTYYLGTQPDAHGMGHVLDLALDTAGVGRPANIPAGVESVRRTDGDSSFLFLLNHSEIHVDVPLDRAAHDLLSDQPHGSSCQLPPLGVAVLRETTIDRVQA